MLLMAWGFLRKSATDASLLLQFCVQVLQSWVQPSGTGSCAAPAHFADVGLGMVLLQQGLGRLPLRAALAAGGAIVGAFAHNHFSSLSQIAWLRP